MARKAAALIRDTVEPEYRKFADYYSKDYKPKCRASVGISATPQGRDYYALQVRIHTTTTLTPDAKTLLAVVNEALGRGPLPPAEGRLITTPALNVLAIIVVNVLTARQERRRAQAVAPDEATVDQPLIGRTFSCPT